MWRHSEWRSIQSPAHLAAVWLDPRYIGKPESVFTEEQHAQIEEYLKKGVGATDWAEVSKTL